MIRNRGLLRLQPQEEIDAGPSLANAPSRMRFDQYGQLIRDVRVLMLRDERPLIVIGGILGTIVATDRRVFVHRRSIGSSVFQYQELTGATGRLDLFSLRYVALQGRGLATTLTLLELSTARNATVVPVWRLPAARKALKELDSLIKRKRTGTESVTTPGRR